MKNIFKRTFHPIGQGAFYSELHRKIDDSGSPKLIVYDCGALTRNKKWLGSFIEKELNQTSPDVLFLSHFHYDHYSGIEFLKPQIIVLPLLSEWDKALFCLADIMAGKDDYIRFAATIEKTFEESRLIYVQSMNEGFDQEENLAPLFIEEIAGRRATIRSGQPLASRTMPDWLYIPINPALDPHITNRFKALLEQEGLKRKDILECNPVYFAENRKKLKQVYNAIGSPNEYSMIVYSGPASGLRKRRPLPHPRTYACAGPRFSRLWFYHDIRPLPRSGCLYLGDINLNSRLGSASILEVIYRALPQQAIEEISSIQVPHHGSKRNYNANILKYFDKKGRSFQEWDRPVFFIISAGLKNPYQHPCGHVLKSLLCSGHPTALVTDRELSRISQIWSY